MEVYFGSNRIVNQPKIITDGYYKDFGYGFYCANFEKQAKRWALSIPWWRSHPIHKNRATESIWTEPCNPLLRAAKSTKRATFNL